MKEEFKLNYEIILFTRTNLVTDVDALVKEDNQDPETSQSRPHGPHQQRGSYQQNTQHHLRQEFKSVQL